MNYVRVVWGRLSEFMSLTFSLAQQFQPGKIEDYKWIIILIDHVIYFICSCTWWLRERERRRCMTLKLYNFISLSPSRNNFINLKVRCFSFLTFDSKNCVNIILPWNTFFQIAYRKCFGPHLWNAGVGMSFLCCEDPFAIKSKIFT